MSPNRKARERAELMASMAGKLFSPLTTHGRSELDKVYVYRRMSDCPFAGFAIVRQGMTNN